MRNCQDVPSIENMHGKFLGFIKDYWKEIESASKWEGKLARYTHWYFTRRGKELGYCVRAENNFRKLEPVDDVDYPHDVKLLIIDLAWILDNPYHKGNKEIHDWNENQWPKKKSGICLALEYEQGDFKDQQDELWKLSFVNAKVKTLVYATKSNEIPENDLKKFENAISNFLIRQDPPAEWRIFAVNERGEVFKRKINP